MIGGDNYSHWATQAPVDGTTVFFQDVPEHQQHYRYIV